MCFEIVLKIQLTFSLMAWFEKSKTPRLFCKRSDGAGHLSRFFAERKLSLTANLHCCKTSFYELTTLTTLATSLQHNMFIMIYPFSFFSPIFFNFLLRYWDHFTSVDWTFSIILSWKSKWSGETLSWISQKGLEETEYNKYKKNIVGNKKDNKSREIHTWVDWGGAEKLNLLPTKCKRGVR